MPVLPGGSILQHRLHSPARHLPPCAAGGPLLLRWGRKAGHRESEWSSATSHASLSNPLPSALVGGWLLVAIATRGRLGSLAAILWRCWPGKLRLLCFSQGQMLQPQAETTAWIRRERPRVKPHWGFDSLRLGRGWEERWAAVAPDSLGFSQLPLVHSSTLASTRGEAGAERRRDPLPPLSLYHYPDLLSSLKVRKRPGWASRAPWVARSAVREGGSGTRPAGEMIAGSRCSSGVAAAGGKRGLWKRRQDQSRVCMGGRQG